MTVLRFLDEPAPCRACGLPTVTIKFGGRIPMHVSCDKRPAEALSREDLIELVNHLGDVLGPLELGPALPPARPLDVGPCVTCQKPTRRYGPFGRACCHTCDEGSAPLVDPNQLELFHPAHCECDHEILAVADGEPCPNCLTDPEQPHDCPLRLEEVGGLYERDPDDEVEKPDAWGRTPDWNWPRGYGGSPRE